MLCPVLGLRPVRALRVDTENVPKPEMFTLSPWLSAAVISSNIVLTARSAMARGRSTLLATDSMSSALVIPPPGLCGDEYPGRYNSAQDASQEWAAGADASVGDDVSCGFRLREGGWNGRLYRDRRSRLAEQLIRVAQH